MSDQKSGNIVRLTTYFFWVFAGLQMVQYALMLIPAKSPVEGAPAVDQVYINDIAPFVIGIGVQLLATILLWRFRKTGFFAFVFGWAIAAFVPIFMSRYAVSSLHLCAILFCGLYALGWKHLK